MEYYLCEFVDSFPWIEFFETLTHQVLGHLFQHGRCVHHVQRIQKALKALEQQFSCLAKDVKDLNREEEANYEQSNRRHIVGHPMHDNQWGYGNFSPHTRSYEPNYYDCYESNKLGARDCYNEISCRGVPRNDVGNGGNYVKMD
ncbi:hypothetical protein M9H77_17317 [Catharanthus roseus]|uniref:Uncharacterized protein n=1 Tax=Catharanthus roseus TaxID=4058 RepID=A0ACC0B499_CATRO|nr:hypothetical protein M9H77_17317 [Catharanthus roseus]